MPLEHIDFVPELDSIREWRHSEESLVKDEKIWKKVWDKVF